VAAVVNRARLDLQLGKTSAARKRFEDAVNADPSNMLMMVLFAQFEEGAQRKKEARGLLDRAMKVAPNALEPYIVLLDILKKENSRGAALELAESMLAAHPRDPIAIESAADTMLWHGDHERTLATLKRLVAVSPKSPSAYFKLARVQALTGLKAEADINLQKALEMSPEDMERPVSVLMDDSKLFEAIEIARKSTKIRRGSSRTMQLNRGLGVDRDASELHDALSRDR